MAVKTKDILEGSILKQLTLLFIPIFLGYLCKQLYDTFDAFIVGQYVNKQALAAIGGSTSNITSLLTNFVLGLSAGLTIIMAQLHSRGREDKVLACVQTSFFVAIVLGLIMTIVGIVTTKSVLELTNVPEDVLPYSATYMKLFYIGSIPTLIYEIGSSLLRAVGDSKRPLYILIITCVLHIIFDFLFIKVCNFGITGVGLAYLLSQTISCVLILYIFYKGEDSLSYSFKDFGFDKDMLIKTIKVGLPLGLQQVLYSVTNIYIQALINNYQTDVIAASTAYGKLEALFWNFDTAIGIAITTMLAQNYGAGKIDRFKKIVRVGICAYMVATAVISVVNYAFTREILSIFTTDANVIEIGIVMSRFMILCWWQFGFIQIYSAAIKSAGRTLITTVICAVGICAVRIIYLMVYDCQNFIDVYHSYPLSWVITSLVFVVYYYSGRWLKREQARD